MRERRHNTTIKRIGCGTRRHPKALTHPAFLEGLSYYAVLLAFVVFTFAVFPVAIFMYQPDVFQDHAVLQDFIVFPGNLLWLSDSLLRITPVILLASAVIILLLLAGGERRLKRIDIE